MSRRNSVEIPTGAPRPMWASNALKEVSTAAEAMKQAKLDFEVLQSPAKYSFGGDIITAPEAIINHRSDTGGYLGTVTKAYGVVQNSDAFAFFDQIVDKNEAIYVSAGSIDGGKRIWLMAELPPHIMVGKDDAIKNYVLLYNTHSGKGGTVACLTPHRVFCSNQLGAIIAQSTNKVMIRHTKNAVERLHQAHQLLGISNLYNKELSEIFNAMAGVKMKNKQIEKYILDIYPNPTENMNNTNGARIREGILEAMEVGVGQDTDTCKGTLFGAYNAVTYYNDHMKKYKDDSAKLKSTWFGGSSNIRQLAFDAAIQRLKNN